MRAQLLSIRPSNWYVNQYTHNYLNSSSQQSNSTCPVTRPYLISARCSLCRDTQVYDAGSSSCASCPDGSYFSELTHSCLSSAAQIACSGGRIQNSNGVCACPSGIPFWTGSSCVACFAPYYFDFGTRECLVCHGDELHNGFRCLPVKCGAYQTFDMHMQRCVCLVGYRPS